MCPLPEASKERPGTPPALVHTLSLTNIYSSSSLKKTLSFTHSYLSSLPNTQPPAPPNSIFFWFSFHYLLSYSPVNKYDAFNHQHGRPSPCHVHQLVPCVGKRGPRLSKVLPSSSNAIKKSLKKTNSLWLFKGGLHMYF